MLQILFSAQQLLKFDVVVWQQHCCHLVAKLSYCKVAPQLNEQAK